MEHGDWLAAFIDQQVIAEIGEGFTVLGTLTGLNPTYLEFSQVDLHNQFEANSTRDVYALETASLGIRPNRKQLFVPRDRLICIGRLSDVEP